MFHARRGFGVRSVGSAAPRVVSWTMPVPHGHNGVVAGAARIVLTLLAGALVCASLASAAAKPVVPAPNAVLTDGTPKFAWSVPEGETTTDVYVSTSKATVPRGAFVNKNIVDSQVFSSGEKTWTPTRQMFGGTYWWNVKTRNEDRTKSFYSKPQSFTIKPGGTISSLRITPYRDRHYLFISSKWRANTKPSALILRVKRGSKVVWTKKLAMTAVVPMQEH